MKVYAIYKCVILHTENKNTITETHNRQHTHFGQFIGGRTLFNPPDDESFSRLRDASPVVNPLV